MAAIYHSFKDAVLLTVTFIFQRAEGYRKHDVTTIPLSFYLKYVYRSHGCIFSPPREYQAWLK